MSTTTRSLFIALCALLLLTTAMGADDHDHDHDHDHEHDSHDEFETTDLDDHDHDHDHDHHHHGDEENLWIAFGITTGAGLAALIGACSIFCIKKEWVALIPASLSFSSGVIVYLCFMNLIPEAIELLYHATGEESEALAHFYALLCVILGLAITVGMEYGFKKMGIHSHGDPEPLTAADANNTKGAEAETEMATSTDANDKEPADEAGDVSIEQEIQNKTEEPQSLKYISYSVAFALIMHHFPEGIATFVSLYYDLEFGALVAFALALHDIPSGICISVTTYCATGSMAQPFILCTIAALIYPFGAFIGWAIIETQSDEFTDVFIGVLFGITGGIMLYVAFVELLPTAILAASKQNKYHSYVYTLCLCLLFAGFMVMDISAIVLAETGGHSH